MSHNHSRFIRPAQLVALLVAFVSTSALIGVLGAGMLVPLTGSLALATKSMPEVFNDLPSEIEVVEPAEESHMLDSTGAVIARFYDKQRIVVPSANIADIMKQAIVAVEDKRFYEHDGVDATGIARAFVNNLAETGTQGASTITQQYVRNALLEKGYLEGDAEQVNAATEQTAARKLREIKYALALERKLDKDQVLTGYLNIAPFGPITYGVEAASQRYFSKSASEINYLEAAMLAGLVQSPVEYNPLSYPEAAKERRDLVLGLMFDQEVITQEEYDAGVATAIEDMLNPNVSAEGCSGASGSSAYFCDYVLSQFLADDTYGDTSAKREHMLKTAGITIRTTLDPTKQAIAWNSLTGAIPVDDASDVDTALVSVEPSTGHILVMSQNTNYGVEAGQTMANYAANGQFQVGSTYKVFTLLQWFKEGHSAYETVGSANRYYGSNAFHCGDQAINTGAYNVVDLPGKDGAMNVIRATGLSVNQAFVNMASRVDFCQIFQTAYDLGVTQNGEVADLFPANILGTSSTNPLEVAGAFAAIANSGNYCKPNAILSVTDRDENTLKEYTPECSQIIPETAAQQTATTLTQAVGRYYTSTQIADGRQFAGKSGTTDNNSNTWMSGFTPSLATSAWVGHANASTQPVQDVTINGVYYAQLYGETFVGRTIWAPYMSAVLAGTPIEPMPMVSIGSPAPQPRTQQPAAQATEQYEEEDSE